MASGSFDHKIILWDLKDWTPQWILECHSDIISCVKITKIKNNIIIVSSSGDGTIKYSNFNEKTCNLLYAEEKSMVMNFDI